DGGLEFSNDKFRTAGPAATARVRQAAFLPCFIRLRLIVDQPGKEDFKLDLANRFVYFPLVRLLIFSFWFRLIFAGFLLFLIFLGLFLPRIWRTTPPGFLPVVKISGLDMAQAWPLKRSELRLMNAGDLDQAAYAWR